MSDIRINTSRDLESFLRILAEESVSSAHNIIKEDARDPAQDRYSRKTQKKEIKNLSMLEQEEEEFPEEAPAPPAPSPRSEESEDVQEQEPEDEGDVPEKTASRASIPDDINDLRQGYSVKDPDVRPELQAYLEALDDIEVKILDKFLGALSGILNKRIKASAAPDPSDSLDLDYVEKSKDPEASSDEPVDVSSPGGATTPPPPGMGMMGSTPEEEELEDISPPVRVGSPQQLAEIRRKVRNLMKM